MWTSLQGAVLLMGLRGGALCLGFACPQVGFSHQQGWGTAPWPQGRYCGSCIWVLLTQPAPNEPLPKPKASHFLFLPLTGNEKVKGPGIAMLYKGL